MTQRSVSPVTTSNKARLRDETGFSFFSKVAVCGAGRIGKQHSSDDEAWNGNCTLILKTVAVAVCTAFVGTVVFDMKKWQLWKIMGKR